MIRKEQTAMQFLISTIDANTKHKYRDSDYSKGYLDALEHCRNEAVYLKEWEKRQILEARMQDMDSGLDPHTYIDIANEYYNENYLEDNEL